MSLVLIRSHLPPPYPTQPCCRLGALSGILATITFPPLQRTLGLVATASLSVWLQLLCLVAAVAPAVLSAVGVAVSAQARMYALVWGLVLSRFGLWSFDLASNQLIQESVEHGELGSVNGVQGSLQSLFQVWRIQCSGNGGSGGAGSRCGGWGLMVMPMHSPQLAGWELGGSLAVD